MGTQNNAMAPEDKLDDQTVLEQAQVLLQETEAGVQEANRVATRRLHDAALVLKGRQPRRWRQVGLAWLAGFATGVVFTASMVIRSARRRRV